MRFKNIDYILTDIEGTTTSVEFVYKVLFPYFLENIDQLEAMKSQKEVQEAFKATVQLASKMENHRLNSSSEIIATLKRWCLEDKKITPLKTVQGVIWKDGYESGKIKGHVYPDVRASMESWKSQGLKMGVFSSGSVAAQKLIFGFSEIGDLTPNFSQYFDTETGGKREPYTYEKITAELDMKANRILFLSDVMEELQAAEEAGMQTCQLVRPGTESNWQNTVANFTEIELENEDNEQI
ncbi:MAG: acireductone synthase [Crocinitomicaceae bacterium]